MNDAASEVIALQAGAMAAVATGIGAMQDGTCRDGVPEDVSLSNDPVEIAAGEDHAVHDRTIAIRAGQDRLDDALGQEGSVRADAGPAERRGAADPAGSAPCTAAEPILCGHCGRTAGNGISCQGFCVADSGY
ncbi:MAG: hypothetical protein VKJ44_06290 [Synechococcus sp.]|nr:hypothetical protein [Synechococcus sp.]